ncbi:MAG: histidine kinase [Variovorax sp.]|nr:histidine kinase [Variovorax sp.]
MLLLVLTIKVQSDHALVTLRDRTRQVSEVFGLESLQRTRLITAVSEIGRNALQYAGGAVVNFLVGESSIRLGAEAVVVQVVDKGPGISEQVIAVRSSMSIPGKAQGGLQGSRRLVDAFWVESAPGGGTTVSLEMMLPRVAQRLTPALVTQRIEQLVRRPPQSPREELEQQNREMLHTLQELRRRQRELEQADERKNEFVAMLAHELRNPLSAITMALELMRRKPILDKGDVERYCATIGRQTDQLTHLVNDLMDVSRVTRGKVDLERTVVEMNALVGHAVEMTRAFIDAKRHDLTIESTAEQLWVDVDVVRMKQVVSNLIHNAARYTPASGRLQVSVSSNGHVASVAIRDNGMGIEAAMLPKIFDLFTQVDTSLAREDSGLGIGLTIVQRMVRDHGGSITATSPGKGLGSEFVLTLPLVGAPVSVAVPLEVAVALKVDVPARAGRRLLVVDDNQDAVSAMREMLELSGYECEMAFDGATALAMAMRRQPDVAVLDIGLPSLDGFEVARALRTKYGPQVVLIALSGYSAPEMRKKAEMAGFNSYFVKPVDFSALTNVLLEIPNASGHPLAAVQPVAAGADRCLGG